MPISLNLRAIAGAKDLILWNFVSLLRRYIWMWLVSHISDRSRKKKSYNTLVEVNKPKRLSFVELKLCPILWWKYTKDLESFCNTDTYLIKQYCWMVILCLQSIQMHEGRCNDQVRLNLELCTPLEEVDQIPTHSQQRHGIQLSLHHQTVIVKTGQEIMVRVGCIKIAEKCYAKHISNKNYHIYIHMYT